MYKQVFDHTTSTLASIVLRLSDGASIPLDTVNGDYVVFKADILADKAKLQDVDGNIMTPEEAKAYVKELP